jgi:hypothetical protein
MADAIKNFKKLAFTDGDLQAAANMPDTKTCKRCGVEKEYDHFRLDWNNKDTLHSWCNRCERLYHRNYYKDVTKLKVA